MDYKFKVYLKSAINGKYTLTGSFTEQELEDMKSFSFNTVTIGGVTVSRNEIIGWEPIKED